MHPQQLLEGCAELVALVMRFDHPADSIISRFFREHRGLGQRERATLADTAYSVLRYRAMYELMARSAPKGMGNIHRKLAMLAFAAPRDYLQAALLPLERAWVETCDAQIKSGEGFMDLHKHNLPEWLATLLKAQVGDQFWPLVKALNESAPLDLRVNTFKVNREQAFKELQETTHGAVKAAITPFSPWGIRLQGKPALNLLPIFSEGRVEVQDEGSQLLALLTGAKRGEMVADFCAGAGGKTLALGAMMKNTGRLYAFDTSQKRLDGMKPRLARSGLSNIHPVAIAHERDERIKRLAGKMDRVLVDAPCSGLGTLRRNPDLKWRQKETDVAELAELQTKILQSAARLAKSGGRLVYATCSLLQEENEAIAQAFGAANSDFVPMDVAELLTSQKIENTASLCAGSEESPTRYLRLWPQVHGSDGFFAAVWVRK
jgi:16S rRNA (cytosine967-C5)-methyltransferase